MLALGMAFTPSRDALIDELVLWSGSVVVGQSPLVRRLATMVSQYSRRAERHVA